MIYPFWISVICFFLLDECVADEHIYGTKKGVDFYKNEILNKNHTVPKNYTILFEYVGSENSPFVDFCRINTTVNSTANFTLVDREKKILKAKIEIPNATNVIATIGISGDAGNFRHSLEYIDSFQKHSTKNAPSRSLTIVYVKNATEAEKPHFQNAIGSRQSGDELLYFESRNVTNVSRFPSRSFEYAGTGNTRITYVGFSFNSPTAIAFINSTFVHKNEFSAITYDMNVEHFVANVSIYGYRNIGPRSTYKEVIEARETCCWCNFYQNKYPEYCGERKFEFN